MSVQSATLAAGSPAFPVHDHSIAGTADQQVPARAVVAGPAAGVDLGGRELQVLAQIAGGGAVAQALARAGHTDGRRRDLPGDVTATLVLGLCLFSSDSYDSLLTKLAIRPPGRAGRPVTGSALCQARNRLGEEPLRELFQLTASQPPPPGQGSTKLGLELTAIDGTMWDLPDTDQIREHYPRGRSAHCPQARMVTLTRCGDRRIMAAALGPVTTSEQALADQLADHLKPGTLNLADRAFFSMRRWVTFAATGAHLLWRIKTGARSLAVKLTQVLPDGSALVRLRESASMLSRRRTDAADKTLPRLPDTLARMIEFHLTATTTTGKQRTTRYRLLTTLLDPHQHPAATLADLYAQRWQIETTYLRLKTTLRGPHTRLRSRSPHLARQEIWAYLTTYNALCDLAAHAADLADIDPDQISFITVIRLTRHHTTHPPPDGNTNPLTRKIIEQPRNRTNRQRPNTRTQTKHHKQTPTTTTDHTLTLLTPDLPADTTTLN